MRDHWCSRFYRDACALTIAAGTPEIMKEMIAATCGFKDAVAEFYNRTRRSQSIPLGLLKRGLLMAFRFTTY